MIDEEATAHKLPFLHSEPRFCTDNAAMIGWMGWELLNAQQDVDIQASTVNALKRIPLGSYVEGFVNARYNLPAYGKVMSNALYNKRVNVDTVKGNYRKAA